MCSAAAQAGRNHAKRAGEEIREHYLKQGLWQVPHDEETLATLLNVHIVGGTTDLAQHLEGATLRPAIVEKLIEVLRSSGYPGYEEHGLNSAKNVRERTERLYERRYRKNKFIPRSIEKAMQTSLQKQVGQSSLIIDKNATPSEPSSTAQSLSATLRPLDIVAERSAKSVSEAHNEYGSVFQRFETLSVNTGSTMLDQFRPQYVGSACDMRLRIPAMVL